MYTNKDNYKTIKEYLTSKHITLVAVSKTKPIEAIQELYDLGQRDFGENYVQELVEKAQQLPKDIRWHFIGHLQTNKVKEILPYTHLIHSIDSLKLLTELNKQAQKVNTIIHGLLQIHIAQEETKYGLNEIEVVDIVRNKLQQLPNVKIEGIMGMASFTDDVEQIKKEFETIQSIKDDLENAPVDLPIVSIGMSSDYTIAADYGSTMVRIGSLLFGKR
jgi:PLP dependent protein